MPKDLQIIQKNEGAVDFDVYGKLEDTGLALLQRIYTLLLSGRDADAFDTSADGLLARIGSSNIPSNTALQSILTTACASARAALDEEDALQVTSITADVVESGGDSASIQVTILLAGGTTITGVLK